MTEAEKPAEKNDSAPAADEEAGQKTDPKTDPKTDQKTETPVGKNKLDRQTGKKDRQTGKKDRQTGKKDRQTGKKVLAGANMVRSRIASLVWLVAVVCALFLAIGALLIALKANQDNAIVRFVLDGADKLDLGVFSRKEGIFTFDGKSAATKNALVNWGIGAIAYLVVGKVLDRVIRP